MELNNKVALISGGAGGIGLAIARNLVERGAKVAIADLDGARAEQAAENIGRARSLAIELDVTCEDSWIAARGRVEQILGPCDILVSNTGVSTTGSVDRITVDAWRWVYDVNVMGALLGVRTLLPGMKARAVQAHIVLTCSITSLIPVAEQGAYTTSKAALLNLAGVLKRELADTSIGVSAACPGMVNTELRENAFKARPTRHRENWGPASTNFAQMGMDPAYIGRRVADAIEADEFYVFTHSDYASVVAAERDVMLEAMKQSADPNYVEPPAIAAMPSR